MKPNALIIFVKKPEAGKVKTRLAATIGDEKALEIYGLLLERTRKVAEEANAERYLFYAGEIVEDDAWSSKYFQKHLQYNGDLGERMMHAFKHVFAQGHKHAVIIGSDCPDISNVLLKEAYKALNSNDLCIGPSDDGGYYLLGMNKLHQELFTNKSWSTEKLIEETRDDIKKLNIGAYYLVTLNDIDTLEDLQTSSIEPKHYE